MRGARPLTDREIAKVLTQLGSLRDRALFLLGVRTGFRISELLSLTFQDVARYGTIGNTVTVRRCNMKKKHASRTVALHPQAKAALSEYLASLNNSYAPQDRLFPFGRGHAWRILNDAFVVCRLEGQLGTHCLRKTFADRVYTGTHRDLFKTQIALGHVSPASTVNYLSFKQEEIDAVVIAT